jgi:hypothetical protein
MNSYDLFERWHPYWDWECFKSGMWQRRRKEMTKVQQCAKLLSDPAECHKAMLRAVNEYPISAEQHLTKSMGRRPWLGQAACCVEVGATEEETRVAWNFYMSPAQQDSANGIADAVISDWEISNA